MTGLDPSALQQVEGLKTIVHEELSCFCLVPELIKFKGDVSAQGAAYYTRYLVDERQSKISQAPRRWDVIDVAEVKRVETRSGVEGSKDLDLGADQVIDHEMHAETRE